MVQTLIDMAPNGRLVIPASTRSTLGITGRERFSVDCQDGAIVLTPVVVVPIDRSFPVTPELIAAADRAAAEDGKMMSRSDVHARMTKLARS